jgi:hypothetical protein
VIPPQLICTLDVKMKKVIRFYVEKFLESDEFIKFIIDVHFEREETKGLK